VGTVYALNKERVFVRSEFLWVKQKESCFRKGFCRVDCRKG